MMFLEAVKWSGSKPEQENFPFSLPILQNLKDLKFTSPVTFFVGENGSGKSTLLKAIAVGMSCISISSADLQDDPTLAAAKSLAKKMTFVRRQHPKVKTFFRAEDAFGFTKRVIQDVESLQDLEAEFRSQFTEGSLGQKLAIAAARKQRRAYQGRYGENPDGFSHGELFLQVLQTRLVPQGLYLLDEPETPLSPTRVLALISLLKDKVSQECQFIIATHSPILMAFPQAQILQFAQERIQPISYTNVEHVSITKSFLNNPQSFLRYL
jgi:predicted ATPase